MPSNSDIRSYGSAKGFAARMREAFQLVRKTRQSWARIDAEVRRVIEQCRIAENITTEKTGVKLQKRKMLEIGVGQLPRQTAYFAVHNDVTGIDLDIVPRGIDPLGYLRLMQSSGPGRMLKTAARKLSGFDLRYARTMCRELGINRLPRFTIAQMDAVNLKFPNDSFDFVYSFDVFEHLPDPALVLRQVKRVLRPGGVLLAYIHLYTCDSGHHDLRVYLPGRGNLPFWAHLRQTTQSQIQTYVTLNRLRLGDWRRIFDIELPGTSFSPITLETDQQVRDALPGLRAAGELADYTDEELLADRIIAVWKKS